MKVNFIVPEIARSGGMRVIFEYAGRLNKKGHDVVLYTPVIPFDPYKGLANREFRKYRIKYAIKILLNKNLIPENIFPYDFKIMYVPQISDMFIRNADAVIATSWTSSYFVDRLNISKGKKSYLVQDFEIWNCNRDLAEKSYSLPLQIITVSGYLKDLLKSKFNKDAVVIMPGIDYSIFHNENKKYSDDPVISFADHQLENKNIEGAVYTCEKIKELFPRAEFVAFGSSMHHSFPGFIKFIQCTDDADLKNIYCTTDIFLFPSLNEGFGLPPAEAMACKCAAVGNKVAAFPEYSVNDVTAVHCDPDDADGLFKGVCSLLGNRDKLKSISESAAVEIRKILDWDNSVNAFEKIIF